MAPKLPDSTEIKAWLRRVLRPKTKLGKTTLWFGGLTVILELLRLITRSPSGTMLSGWTSFLLYVFFVCAFVMGLRWVRRQLMWRLRNRLIVTYVFIGVIPMVLLVTMALVAGYLFAGQFATYVAMSDLQSELQHLESANDSLAVQFRSLVRAGKLNEQLATEIAAASSENFRRRTVSVWEGERGFILMAGRTAPENRPIKVPAAINGDFHGFVLDDTHLHLRAVRHLEEEGRHLTVISIIPISAELLKEAAAQLGSVSVFPPDRESERPVATVSGAAKERRDEGVRVDFQDKGASVSVSEAALARRVEAGRVPPPTNFFDVRFPFATRFPAVDWE